MNKTPETKRAWLTPQLTVYGNLEQLTRGQGRPKTTGTQDDLHTHGLIS